MNDTLLRSDSAVAVASDSIIKHDQSKTNRSRTRESFELRDGRRYIRDVPYPLPCDLQELHRQNLRTQLACTVFGRAVCYPSAFEAPPSKVLEVGCGTGYWSVRCHQMYSSMQHANIIYTGIDIAPLAPDLRRNKLNWTFVQHDIRRCPWPFEDESFDLIMCKDLSTSIPLGTLSQQVLDECIRLLRVGGTLEVWDSDHTVRSLLPHPPQPGVKEWEHKLAEKTATFPMSPITPFAPSRNRYFKSANSWIIKALDELELPATPCARMTHTLLQEPHKLADVGFRRIAIPLTELDWEQEARAQAQEKRETKSPRGKARHTRLNSEQRALRDTALLTVVQMIESLEPMLKQTSGKNAEEWSYWWTSMMNNLTNPAKKSLDRECLEIGAWWATKIGEAV